MGLGIEGSNVLNQANAAILLHDSKDWTVVWADGWFIDYQFEPLQ